MSRTIDLSNVRQTSTDAIDGDADEGDFSDGWKEEPRSTSDD
jgi:hypothetical protein